MDTNPFGAPPEAELTFSFVRSSGPGGQNVNKVNSKAVLRWNVLKSPSLLLEQRARLLTRLQNRLTTEGDIVITSDRYRDQGRNREDCIEKLHQLIASALSRPKARHSTRPTRSSQRRRRDAKTRQAQKKKLRGSRSYD